jgi:hypothetical protein
MSLQDNRDPFAGFIEIHEADRDPRYKSADTYRRWIRAGKLRAYKHGRDVYLKLSDLAPKPIEGPVRRAVEK